MINAEKSLVVTIYADLLQNLLCCHLGCKSAKKMFCRDLRTLCGEKLIQKVLVEKKGQLSNIKYQRAHVENFHLNLKLFLCVIDSQC